MEKLLNVFLLGVDVKSTNVDSRVCGRSASVNIVILVGFLSAGRLSSGPIDFDQGVADPLAVHFRNRTLGMLTLSKSNESITFTGLGGRVENDFCLDYVTVRCELLFEFCAVHFWTKIAYIHIVQLIEFF